MSSNNKSSETKTEYHKNLPVYDINVPGGGPQQTVVIKSDTPIYSSYTGDLIQYGPIGYNVRCDAPIGHPNYGKDFHVIERIRDIDAFMAHGVGVSNYGRSIW